MCEHGIFRMVRYFDTHKNYTMKNGIAFVLVIVSFFLSSNADLSLLNKDINGHEEECESHKSCSDCVSSHIYCHWCSSDETCHSTKNWMQHSCVIGSECTEECERSQPEFLYDNDEHKAGVWMIVFIGVFSFGSILSCSFRSRRGNNIDMDIHDLKLEEVRKNILWIN